ncbi:MAG TPA: NAD(P)H-hydrate dehydratase [Gemmata sp.]|nr:NAD(P)H-hydrate dehydratase [Gemmata sp.]
MSIIHVNEIPRLPRRPTDSHKGTFGTVQVIAGSRGMAGAAILTGRGALRGGAGLVRVACPMSVQDVVAGGHPCYTTFGIRQHTDGGFGDGAAEEIIELARPADVAAIGPGLGQNEGVSAFVRGLLAGLPEIPLVVDADGLNAIAPLTEPFPGRAEPLVLTPHPGEFARLLGVSVAEVLQNRESLAIAFAAKFEVVLLLKGANTLVTDGKQLYRNTTGNPGMATGGSGDVLTGLIAALIGQGLSEFAAAVLGAYLHGRAGDIAARYLGQTTLVATDILDHLPNAFRVVEANW